jgi:hypothetical protein
MDKIKYQHGMQGPLKQTGANKVNEQGRKAGFVAKVRRKLQYGLFRQKWNLAITPHPASIVSGLEGDQKQTLALSELCWMEEHRDGFAADPFLVALEPGSRDLTVFYEYLSWREGRGVINLVRSLWIRQGAFKQRKQSAVTFH